MPETPEYNINPGSGCALVEDLEPETEKLLISGSSLEISGGNAHDQLKFGKVLKVGKLTHEQVYHFHPRGYTPGEPGGRVTFPGIEPGEIVAFQSLSAHALRIKGKQYRLVEFEHIKATLKVKE